MAHTHTAEIDWERGEQVFTDQRYSRRHRLRFDAGLEVPGSSSPLVVPVPGSDPQALDPEEAFVSAIASCHMLWFLSIAARDGFVVDSYQDQAVGRMQTNARNKYWMASVTLYPRAVFAGRPPSAAELARMHHEAHEECYIANSVRTDIEVRPRE